MSLSVTSGLSFLNGFKYSYSFFNTRAGLEFAVRPVIPLTVNRARIKVMMPATIKMKGPIETLYAKLLNHCTII